MASLTPTKVMLALLVTVVTAPTAAVIARAKYGPKVEYLTRYKEKIIYKQPSGGCMEPGESGRVSASYAKKYAEPTKEDPEAFSISTYVTFRMNDGNSRICEWDHSDISDNFSAGSYMSPHSGKRIA